MNRLEARVSLTTWRMDISATSSCAMVCMPNVWPSSTTRRATRCDSLNLRPAFTRAGVCVCVCVCVSAGFSTSGRCNGHHSQVRLQARVPKQAGVPSANEFKANTRVGRQRHRCGHDCPRPPTTTTTTTRACRPWRPGQAPTRSSVCVAATRFKLCTRSAVPRPQPTGAPAGLATPTMAPQRAGGQGLDAHP